MVSLLMQQVFPVPAVTFSCLRCREDTTDLLQVVHTILAAAARSRRSG